MTENELIAGCIRQDRACQKQLYEQFYGKMLGVCMRYAKDRDEAKDILHEGFIKMFASLRSYAGKGSFEGWIRRIVVNTAVDHLRRNKHEYLIVSTIRAGEQEDKVDEMDEDDLLSRISKEDIMAAVQQLSPAYRTVFNLYVIEEYAHKEIADMLNISEGTSKSNLAKARYQLQKTLTKRIQSSDGTRTATR